MTSTDLELVRSEVRKVLEASPAWQNMPADERKTLAQSMVQVGSYLAKDPGWLDAPMPPGATAATEALGAVNDLKKRLAQAPQQVGKDFKAGAVREGVQAFDDMVKTVDFPVFVSSLVQGVFQAVVDASIQQMQAYGELMAAVAKTADQFASDHLSEGAAREQMAQRFPGAVRLERGEDGQQRLAPVDGADTSALGSFTRGGRRVDLASPQGEQQFVQAARVELARQRQKLLAVMVLMGINRIVVTNGRINAKVVFDMRASDHAKRMARAGLKERDESEQTNVGHSILPWGHNAGMSKNKHMTTVRSSVDDESKSSVDVRAQLTGEVRLDFRSETVNPDRIVDAVQLDSVQQVAGTTPQPGTPPAQGAPR